MKRIVAIILSTAMLLALFSVSVFAETSVHIDFSLPAVGEAMIKSSDTIPAGEEVYCNPQSVYTGDIIDTILRETNTETLQSYAIEGDFPTDPYRNQRYLIILSLYSETVTLSDTTAISCSANVEEAGVLCTNNTGIFAYLLFTPTENASQGDENNTGSSDDANTENSSDSTTPITQNHEVKVTYDDSVFTRTIVSVDFTWGAMEFTYTPSTEGLWNPNTHEYDDPTEDLWTSTTNNVTITNHSNTALKAVFTYQPATGFSEITGTFIDENDTNCTNREITIESAVGKPVTDAPSATAYLILDGSLAKDVADKTVSGTVTITIQ